MALFGNNRDVSLFRHLNRELVHTIIDTEVLVYKLNLNSTNTNIYDETDSKTYYQPEFVYCLVTTDEALWNNEEFGNDVTQTATFAFLKDDLVDADLVIEIGDIIEYQSSFFELDSIVENQRFVGKDPDNLFGGHGHGYSVSIVFQAHMTRQSKLNLIQTRFGQSEDITRHTKPKNT